jgi:putative flippase GtrA
MRLERLMPHRLRALAPEALRFGAVGLANTVLYFVIFNVTMGIGAVKATVIATVITTTLSYLANRHWTYKHRPKTALRREYTLFFAFNLAGMLIQSGVVGLGKYGLGLNESNDRIAFNLATCVGIGLATAFRFWAYRTLVFKPVDVRVVAAPQPRAGEPDAIVDGAGAARVGHGGTFEAELAGIRDVLDVELRAELDRAELDRQAGRRG